MKKQILVFGLLLTSVFGYTQDFKYEFSVTGITEYGPAKLTINDIRDIIGVRIVKFNDATDRFTILTDYDFDLEEMMTKLESNGVDIAGEISKINLG